MNRTPHALRLLRVAARVFGVAALLAGLLRWAGRPLPWRGAHLGLGLALGATVVALGVVRATRSRRPGALLAAAAWTTVLVGYGVAHARVLPGGAHWVAQLAHVLIGAATVGVAERLAAGPVDAHRLHDCPPPV